MSANKIFYRRRGISLIELLVIMGIMVMIAGIASLNIFGAKKEQDLEVSVKAIVAALRDAQERSIIQEESSEWGVQITNDVTDSYQLLRSGSVYGPLSILKSSLEFNTGSQNIIFAKLTGSVPLEATVEIRFKNSSGVCPSNDCKKITVSVNGTITY